MSDYTIDVLRADGHELVKDWSLTLRSLSDVVCAMHGFTRDPRVIAALALEWRIPHMQLKHGAWGMRHCGHAGAVSPVVHPISAGQRSYCGHYKSEKGYTMRCKVNDWEVTGLTHLPAFSGCSEQTVHLWDKYLSPRKRTQREFFLLMNPEYPREEPCFRVTYTNVLGHTVVLTCLPEQLGAYQCEQDYAATAILPLSGPEHEILRLAQVQGVLRGDAPPYWRA